MGSERSSCWVGNVMQVGVKLILSSLQGCGCGKWVV